MEIIKRGAEAVLYASKFDGIDVIVKERVKKGYRIAQLDSVLRKRRTAQEARLMSVASAAGVAVPRLIAIDAEGAKITMEYLKAERLKDVLDKMEPGIRDSICEIIGRRVAKLHATGIVHGDLTTSNMMWDGMELYLVDFGLGEFSRKVEDKATDMHLLLESLRAAHFSNAISCWKSILSGYQEEYAEAPKIIQKLGDIEKRGRYVKRTEETR